MENNIYNSKDWYRDKIAETQKKIDELTKEIEEIKRQQHEVLIDNLSIEEILNLLPEVITIYHLEIAKFKENGKWFCSYVVRDDEDDAYLYESDSFSFKEAILGTFKLLIEDNIINIDSDIINKN